MDGFFSWILEWNSNRIFLFDEDWKYLLNKSFSTAAYAESIEEYLYITGGSNIWKTDSQLNILMQYNRVGSVTYRGIYDYCSNNLIYAAKYSSSLEIYIFDLNLTFNGIISTSTY